MTRGISVVVLTYNSAELIEDHLVRLVSECNQFEEIEIIVKDGCSIDNTLEKLEKFQNDVLIVSKKDTGIYDALNQATALASNEFIALAHLGDQLIVENMMSLYYSLNEFSGHDIVCGSADIIFSSRKNHVKACSDPKT